MKVYKMSVLGYYGDAYIAADTEEFPMLSANVDRPQVILTALHPRIGIDVTQ